MRLKSTLTPDEVALIDAAETHAEVIAAVETIVTDRIAGVLRVSSGLSPRPPIDHVGGDSDV